jgi:hypothetical protein
MASSTLLGSFGSRAWELVSMYVGLLMGEICVTHVPLSLLNKLLWNESKVGNSRATHQLVVFCDFKILVLD